MGFGQEGITALGGRAARRGAEMGDAGGAPPGNPGGGGMTMRGGAVDFARRAQYLNRGIRGIEAPGEGAYEGMPTPLTHVNLFAPHTRHADSGPRRRREWGGGGAAP